MRKTDFAVTQLIDLYQSLEAYHHKYDPKNKLLKQPLFVDSSSIPVYLGNFFVHPTRESLIYALALLSTEKTKLEQRAIDIIKTIIRLQNKDVNSDNCGTWPKYYEYKIPLSRGKILKPDKNWAEFLSMILLIIIVDYSHALEKKLIIEIKESILLAATLIQSRKVEVWYTNIFIKGIYVALIAGEKFKNRDLYQFGSKQLDLIYQYTLRNGGFGEYNSPNYAVVTLKTLGYLRLHLDASSLKEKVEYLYREVWREIGSHFHASTRQWAAPHSRTYTTLLKKSTLALIDRATSDLINFGTDSKDLTLDMHCLSLKCPLDLEHLFLPIAKPRLSIQVLNCEKPKKVLTTYLSHYFTLGTINYSDFWSQRHLFLAYWGTYLEPNYLRLRCLCDGHDLSTAQFFSVQHEVKVLAGINFATDINQINPYLSKETNESCLFRSKDVRLRFEFGNLGNMENTIINLLNDSDLTAKIELEKIYFAISVPFVEFEAYPIKWEVEYNYDSSKIYLDLVLFSALFKRQIGRLKSQEKAIGLTFQMQAEPITSHPVRVKKDNDTLKIEWEELLMEIKTKPDTQKKLHEAFKYYSPK